MKILVVGSGAREHALIRALGQDSGVTELHAAPGNPGIAELAVTHPVDLTKPPAIADLANELAVDLVIIGPEAPLVAGAVDTLRAAGIAAFGPTAAAAQIEGSKDFAKQVMHAAGVPTARSVLVTEPKGISAALDTCGSPYVVKDDGLAAGKGVVVTTDRTAAAAHAFEVLRTGHQVLVEEFLDGPEVSLFSVCDGSRSVQLLPAQDFKRIGDGDTGPNTGGMGAYAPLPWAPPNLVDQVRWKVVEPVLAEMAARGCPFTGLLYAGLVLTDSGPKVIEFNCRFGDPETQAVLELLQSPLSDLLAAAAAGDLTGQQPVWSDGAAVTVVMAAAGYPGAVRTGDVISGFLGPGVLHAGTAVDDEGRLVTAGGRVLSVTASGSTLAQARQAAYTLVDQIDFDGGQVRRDIAAVAAD